MSCVFTNGLRDLGSIPGCVIPKTLKMVLDSSLLNTQQYKVRIKRKVEQSRKRSNALHYSSVLQLFEKGAFWSPSTTVANLCFLELRGAFNKFPAFFFFCTGFYNWRRLLKIQYIIAIHRMRWLTKFSVSKEQLQQELEYILLKPDCHSWWISEMQFGREDTLKERCAIKFCFKLGKNATETYGILQTNFRPSCMNKASVFEWHKRFKEGRESVRDGERCGRSKEVNTPELTGQSVRVRVRITMLRF